MYYYSSIILLSWMALGALCVLVLENDRISPGDKRLFYLTYALIAAAALAEWCGVHLNGREAVPRWALLAAKCADFILTPMAGGALVTQMRIRNRWRNMLLGALAINTLTQLVAIFNGWMVTVDEHNHYHNGPMYVAYLAVCLVIIALVIIEFIHYGTAFRRQNRRSIYAIMLLMIVGVMMQEVLPSEPRTTYITLTLGAALMYIHYTEFSSLAMDDHLTAQQAQINTDALTGVYSRHAYSAALKRCDAAGLLPEKLVAFTIDINGLKQVNDSLGHEAGDELICGAARCVEEAFGEAGRCFRTGGDEFVVLARMTREEADDALSRLERSVRRWQGKAVKRLTVAAGYALASDNPGITAEKLVREADLAMYDAKAAYYRETGLDRRRPRA